MICDSDRFEHFARSLVDIDPVVLNEILTSDDDRLSYLQILSEKSMIHLL